MEIFVQSPYFTDDKTEAQKEKVICMMSHNLVTWSICQDQRHLLGHFNETIVLAVIILPPSSSFHLEFF